MSSFPAVRFPINAIIEFLKGRGVPTVIDAAHAFGNVPIDLQQIAPAGYFSNFHKWGFSPKSCAFLYLNNELIEKVRPRVSGRTDGLSQEYQGFWNGCRDYTPYLCAEKGLEYIDALGA